MNLSDLAGMLVLVSAAWAAGIALGGAGFWLAAAWLDRGAWRRSKMAYSFPSNHAATPGRATHCPMLASADGGVLHSDDQDGGTS